jgi:hypothetical protein
VAQELPFLRWRGWQGTGQEGDAEEVQGGRLDRVWKVSRRRSEGRRKRKRLVQRLLGSYSSSSTSPHPILHGGFRTSIPFRFEGLLISFQALLYFVSLVQRRIPTLVPVPICRRSSLALGVQLFPSSLPC